jgi:hypothetical protein
MTKTGRIALTALLVLALACTVPLGSGHGTALIPTAQAKTMSSSAPKLKSITNTPTGIKIAWAKKSKATSYKVYRAKVAADGSVGAYVLIRTNKVASSKLYVALHGYSATSYIDTSASDGQGYAYKVRAYAGSKKTAYSNVLQAVCAKGYAQTYDYETANPADPEDPAAGGGPQQTQATVGYRMFAPKVSKLAMSATNKKLGYALVLKVPQASKAQVADVASESTAPGITATVEAARTIDHGYWQVLLNIGAWGYEWQSYSAQMKKLPLTISDTYLRYVAVTAAGVAGYSGAIKVST